MSITFRHRKQETTSGDLRTPITFYEHVPIMGINPGKVERKELYSCFCEAYSPSMKDLTVLDTTGTKEAVTVRIRDSGEEYIPTNKHYAVLDDYRYRNKEFSVVDVRYDMTENRFITILLGVTHG